MITTRFGTKLPLAESTMSALTSTPAHTAAGKHHHASQHHSNNVQAGTRHQQNLIEIKSKFEAEFRRFSLQRSEVTNLEDFTKLIEHFHKLFTIPFCLFYTDPNLGDLLPINNDTNFALAIASAKPLLRLIVQRKGESIDYLNNYGKKKTNFLGNILPVSSSSSSSKNRLAISAPEDFRQVSSIIDVDIVPETCRRVRLVKHGSDKPLGFYIRDGNSVRITEHGLEKVPGIFISRLVPGGLAESTGLLAVNDEVLEVNGIEVNGKSLDQVTDMMMANSSNLIITIRPANQRAAQHSHTLSTSYSSHTISGGPGAAATLGSEHRHHHGGHHHHHHQYYQHYQQPQQQQYTNSLERSGHRSKVADYYNRYLTPSAVESPPDNHHHHHHHLTTPQQQQAPHQHHMPSSYMPSSAELIEGDDDDDDDEDEVRDHFNASSSVGQQSDSSVPGHNNNHCSSGVECVTIGPALKSNQDKTPGAGHHRQTGTAGSSDSDIVTL